MHSQSIVTLCQATCAKPGSTIPPSIEILPGIVIYVGYPIIIGILVGLIREKKGWASFQIFLEKAAAELVDLHEFHSIYHG